MQDRFSDQGGLIVYQKGEATKAKFAQEDERGADANLPVNRHESSSLTTLQTQPPSSWFMQIIPTRPSSTTEGEQNFNQVHGTDAVTKDAHFPRWSERKFANKVRALDSTVNML